MISNIHTHTTFCDGDSTPEDMIRQALQEGMTCLGFSGHSYAPFDPECGMTPAETAAYRADIARLAAAYKSRIRIYTGLEQDFDSPEDSWSWDYRIGSVHYIQHDGQYYPIDHSPEKFQICLDEVFQGRILPLVSHYCEKVLRMYYTRRPDVIGHFDLYRKFNQIHAYFDEEDPAYLSIVEDTLAELVRQDALLEVNTGAIARGLCTTPYPGISLLKFLKQRGARLIITTDAHKAPLLTAGYDQALQLLQELGFHEMTVMGPDGFYEVSVSSSRMR